MISPLYSHCDIPNEGGRDGNLDLLGSFFQSQCLYFSFSHSLSASLHVDFTIINQ